MKSENNASRMIWKLFSRRIMLWSSIFAFLLCLPMTVNAAGQSSGSLLIFPYYDSHDTALTVITITNTCSEAGIDPGTGLQSGTIDIMFKFIDGEECFPTDYVERLTPNDTFSFVPAEYNFSKDEVGFLYVYAIDTQDGNPVAFDYLIGTSTIFDIDHLYSFTLKPLSVRAGTVGPDSDHKLKLDGLEYEKMADELLIPRFFGQGQGSSFDSPFRSRMILINLTGGAYFTAVAKMLVFNDNEQAFSDMVQFDCWEMLDLIDVSTATSLAFLEGTNHDPDEVYIDGGIQMETGWIKLNGDSAHSPVKNFDDPLIYAIQVEESVLYGSAAADLPFEKGVQDNGMLWSVSVSGE